MPSATAGLHRTAKSNRRRGPDSPICQTRAPRCADVQSNPPPGVGSQKGQEVLHTIRHAYERLGKHPRQRGHYAEPNGTHRRTGASEKEDPTKASRQTAIRRRRRPVGEEAVLEWAASEVSPPINGTSTGKPSRPVCTLGILAPCSSDRESPFDRHADGVEVLEETSVTYGAADGAELTPTGDGALVKIDAGAGDNR